MKSNLLPEHRVCLLKSPADWKEIIRQGCRLMEEDGVIAAGFYPEIIRQTEKLGPYMVLADGFALPHLVSAVLVHEAGFALMISPQPVDFLGEAVKAFLIMATPNSSAHVKFLAKIAETLSEPENLAGLLRGDRQIIEMLYQTEGG